MRGHCEARWEPSRSLESALEALQLHFTLNWTSEQNTCYSVRGGLGGGGGLGLPRPPDCPSIPIQISSTCFLNALVTHDVFLTLDEGGGAGGGCHDQCSFFQRLTGSDPRCVLRLLLEESDEEEGDLCRICQMGEDSASNPLLQPCHCTGSLQFVHQECIKRWLCSKIHSGEPRNTAQFVQSTEPAEPTCCFRAGTNLESVTTCELCKKKLHLHIDDFDIEELYRTYVQVSPRLTSDCTCLL